MTKDQFFEQIMIGAVGRGINNLDQVMAQAERAWTLLNPPPVPKPSFTGDDAERILAVLRDGPIVAVGGDMPVRARDVLLQAMRRKHGAAMATGRLHAALSQLEAAGAIRWTDDRKRLALA